MEFDERLAHPSQPFLVLEEGKRRDLLVGAPHHAPAGVENLPGRVSDENAGYLACYLAKQLGCTSVVMVNGVGDPNKSWDTEYAMAISAREPRLLLEIHGHGGRSAWADVEISAGSREREHDAIQLAEELKKQMQQYAPLKELSVAGAWDRIHFTATKAVTINTDRWRSLHLELPAALRIEGEGKLPPEAGYLFCDALAVALGG